MHSSFSQRTSIHPNLPPKGVGEGGVADVSPAQWSRQEASDRQVVEGTGKEVGDFPFVSAPPAPGQPH